MKTLMITAAAALLSAAATPVQAQQADTKRPVYAELGLGINKTLYFGDTRTTLARALGGSAKPGTGNNILAGFYVAPEAWRGLGVGSRISGSFGAPVEGDFGDKYIFNYYNLALAAKYYGLSRAFGRGLYARGSVGFGQLTTKRFDEETNFYRHQYALGTSLMAGVGYALPLKGYSLGLEAEFESASRSGTVDGIGNQTFRSGQVGVNVIVGF
ncbi:outer membrane beta-barrel protein [Hymenobacter sp.]|uniref:outer membrane beta-barrel protein n=1 Tax=Hymenobacter sp. TaxID=1898978 RepID=UPI00286AAEB1|nr:outer membrane beta-barrel protein [Hymenobacter sp.]